MKVLAEIPARSSSQLRTGTLRRADLAVYGSLLEELRPARSVLITGEAPGRRGVAAGLAAAAAAPGNRTALHECVRGNADSEAILKPVTLAGPGSAKASDPLVCVVAGRPADDGAVLLDSERFRHAVSGLENAYELLVLDGPPPGRVAELFAAMTVAEVTLAWSERGTPPPSLPGPAAGLVVQAEGSPQRS